MTIGLLSPLILLIKHRTSPTLLQLLCTYIIPINPLVLGYDGTQSTLRTYDDIDVQQMCNNIAVKTYDISNKLQWTSRITKNESSISAIDKKHGYEWTYAVVRHRGWRFWMPNLVYIMGIPIVNDVK